MSNAPSERESIHIYVFGLYAEILKFLMMNMFPLSSIAARPYPSKWNCNANNRFVRRNEPHLRHKINSMKYDVIMRCECPRMRTKWSTRRACSGREWKKPNSITAMWCVCAWAAPEVHKMNLMQDSMHLHTLGYNNNNLNCNWLRHRLQWMQKKMRKKSVAERKINKV